MLAAIRKLSRIGRVAWHDQRRLSRLNWPGTGPCEEGEQVPVEKTCAHCGRPRMVLVVCRLPAPRDAEKDRDVPCADHRPGKSRVPREEQRSETAMELTKPNGSAPGNGYSSPLPESQSVVHRRPGHLHWGGHFMEPVRRVSGLKSRGQDLPHVVGSTPSRKHPELWSDRVEPQLERLPVCLADPRKIADVDHLVGHKRAGRDVFVTDDGGILRKAEALRVECGIHVMTPDQALDLIERSVNKPLLADDFRAAFTKVTRLVEAHLDGQAWTEKERSHGISKPSQRRSRWAIIWAPPSGCEL